ncbi:MAG: squalene--hopene cyclase [Verrucomicrobia bacterium]|nr:squalene--hopene cyclase [Verrucomicrobiota bacterium]
MVNDDAGAHALLKQAVSRAQQHLISLQHPEGYWIGELIVDSTLCSDYVTFMHWSGDIDLELQQKCIDHILSRQLPDGGWNIYPEGPSEVNASVKAYLALTLAGFSKQDPILTLAREKIRGLGGIEKTNTYARLYLALLGQLPWDAVPTIPVEFLLLPRWLPVNLYAVSSWTRAMVVPLAIINHYKPTRVLPAERGISELYLDPTQVPHPRAAGLKQFFILVDRCLKIIERNGILPLRKTALNVAERWMLERIGDGCSGLAAIFPAMLNSMIALRCIGYQSNHPIYQKADADFRELFVEDEQGFRIQPCFSPVWDTAITLVSLARSGIGKHHLASRKAVSWLLSQEVRIAGDWAVNNPKPEPTGWCFEFNNPFCPDVDDTAMVLLALHTAGYDEDPQMYDRVVHWLLSFQNRDGGWAAFDKDVQNPLLENVPFADHNAILDPSCSDVTARVLEILGNIGFRPTHPAIDRAITFLREKQEPNGAWYGRWGVNYIYGTSQVLRGLRAVDLDMDEPWIQLGRDWLEACQNEDGGWGETVASYDDPSLRGKGQSTPSQSAWALLGLCAFQKVRRRSVERGIQYLISCQNPDGSWNETLITGTGFPRVFYLKYDMYRNNWPLMALARYAIKLSANQHEPESDLDVVSGVLSDSAQQPQEAAFPSLISSFASLPVFVLMKDLLTKLNHG